MIKLGVVGVGRLGTAIVEGVSRSNIEIYVFDEKKEQLKSIEAFPGVRVLGNAKEVFLSSDLCLLSVEPSQMVGLVKALPSPRRETMIVSVAAGVTLAQLEEISGSQQPLMRVMTNSPAKIGSAMSAICVNAAATSRQTEMGFEIFQSIGSTAAVDEKFFDLVTAICGSGPAFHFLFLEAVVNMANEAGLSYELALKLATETMVGSARLAATATDDLASLRERVTTRGGCTEAGLHILSDRNFSKILQDCYRETTRKAKSLGETQK